MATNNDRHKDVILTLRVPKEVRDKIRRWGKSDDRGLGNMARILLLRAFKAEEESKEQV